MRIAIVAPSGVPFAVGGAEKLWWGLTHHINQLTPHHAELIKLPSPERTFSELMASYRRFAELDLSSFDQVISTKYPAWMVCHPNHILYLQHRLRGVYDTYHFSNKAEHYSSAQLKRLPSCVQQLYKSLEITAPGRESLAPFWHQLTESMSLAPECFEFPGPLTRKVIHFLDAVALSPESIKRYFAISNNVAGRVDYFPASCRPEVIYHPSDLSHFKNTGDDYVFTISRLEAPKRIDLLIRAFKETSIDVEFRIAGDGPQGALLKELAKDDLRIKFLGSINDQEVITQYAGAIFVPYIPCDEDYGLITIEAMASGKAVLSTTDAGGPREFIETGETGLIVPPECEALTQAMMQLIEDREGTRQMGERARQRTAPITWSNTIARLLVESSKLEDAEYRHSLIPQEVPARQKWLVVLTFDVWPPMGGGQSRVYNLYRELAKTHDVTLLALTESGQEAAELKLAPGLREIRIPRSPDHRRAQRELEAVLDASVGDIAAMAYYDKTPQFIDKLLALSAEADLVVASHPYTYPAIREVYRGELWYEAHNVEYDMKAAVLPDTEKGRDWLDSVRKVEKACYRDAKKVLVCSEADKQRFENLYGSRNADTHIVPNGAVLSMSLDQLGKRRPGLRKRLGLCGNYTALFMGSWHAPNIEAVVWLLENAKDVPGVSILLAGSVCQHPVCARLPANVYKLGVLGERQKNVLIQAVDLAINPVVTGSGTNIKMLDYAAAGTLILSTHFGNRGLPFKDGESVILAGREGFMTALRHLSQKKRVGGCSTTSASAYRAVNGLNWQKIAANLLENI